MVDVVLLTSCRNIYKLQSSLHSNTLGNRKWDMVASPVQLVKQVSACSYTLMQARNGQKDPVVTWTHQNATETVKYHKALGKIGEHKMHCLLTVKFSDTCTAM